MTASGEVRATSSGEVDFVRTGDPIGGRGEMTIRSSMRRPDVDSMRRPDAESMRRRCPDPDSVRS
jgi:hypothetical protein